MKRFLWVSILIMDAAMIAWAPPLPDTDVKPTTLIKNAWNSLPFSAREWARQTQLPYRRIPLKNGGSMSVQEAYDLFVRAGQPDYPDPETPGLVSPQEMAEQMRISKLRAVGR